MYIKLLNKPLNTHKKKTMINTLGNPTNTTIKAKHNMSTVEKKLP